MTEPHHALTVDGEDSGGNEVHEIYVRLEAEAREQPPSPVRNKDRDVITPSESEVNASSVMESYNGFMD